MKKNTLLIIIVIAAVIILAGKTGVFDFLGAFVSLPLGETAPPEITQQLFNANKPFDNAFNSTDRIKGYCGDKYGDIVVFRTNFQSGYKNAGQWVVFDNDGDKIMEKRYKYSSSGLSTGGCGWQVTRTNIDPPETEMYFDGNYLRICEYIGSNTYATYVLVSSVGDVTPTPNPTLYREKYSIGKQAELSKKICHDGTIYDRQCDSGSISETPVSSCLDGDGNTIGCEYKDSLGQVGCKPFAGYLRNKVLCFTGTNTAYISKDGTNLMKDDCNAVEGICVQNLPQSADNGCKCDPSKRTQRCNGNILETCSGPAGIWSNPVPCTKSCVETTIGGIITASCESQCKYESKICEKSGSTNVTQVCMGNTGYPSDILQPINSIIYGCSSASCDEVQARKGYTCLEPCTRAKDAGYDSWSSNYCYASTSVQPNKRWECKGKLNAVELIYVNNQTCPYGCIQDYDPVKQISTAKCDVECTTPKCEMYNGQSYYYRECGTVTPYKYNPPIGTTPKACSSQICVDGICRICQPDPSESIKFCSSDSQYSRTCSKDGLSYKANTFCDKGCNPISKSCYLYEIGKLSCSGTGPGSKLMNSTDGSTLTEVATCIIGCDSTALSCKPECTMPSTKCGGASMNYLLQCKSGDVSMPYRWENPSLNEGYKCSDMANSCEGTSCKEYPPKDTQKLDIDGKTIYATDGFGNWNYYGYCPLGAEPSTGSTYKCLICQITDRKCGGYDGKQPMKCAPNGTDYINDCPIGQATCSCITSCANGQCVQTIAIGSQTCKGSAGSSIYTSTNGYEYDKFERTCTASVPEPCYIVGTKAYCKGVCTSGQRQCSSSAIGLPLSTNRYAKLCVNQTDLTLPSDWTHQDCNVENGCDTSTLKCKNIPTSGTLEGGSDGKTVYQYSGSSLNPTYSFYCPLGYVASGGGGFACKECGTLENPSVKCDGKQPKICAANRTDYTSNGVQCPYSIGESLYGYCESTTGSCKQSCLLEGTSVCSTDKKSVVECQSVYSAEIAKPCGIGCVPLTDSFAQCDTVSFALAQQSFILPQTNEITIPVIIDAQIPENLDGRLVSAKICTFGVTCEGANVLKEAQSRANSTGGVLVTFTGIEAAGDYTVIFSLQVTPTTENPTGVITQEKKITLTQDVTIKITKPLATTAYLADLMLIEIEIKNRDGNLMETSGLIIVADIDGTAITPKTVQKSSLGIYELAFEKPTAGKLTMDITPEISLNKLSTVRLELNIKQPYIKVTISKAAAIKAGTADVAASTFDPLNAPTDVDKLSLTVKKPSGKEETITMSRTSKGTYLTSYNFDETGTYTLTYTPYKANYDTVKTSNTLLVEASGVKGIVTTTGGGVSMWVYIVGAIIAIIALIAVFGRGKR